jgi:CRP/FNR family transcriptional regulator, cyclic AMP receptor protein
MVSLKKSPLFSKLSAEELKVLLPLAQPENYPTGSIIFSQDSPAKKIYLLDHGNVALKTAFSEGLEITYEMIRKPGEVFGLSALIAPARFNTTAICLEPTAVLAFSQQDLLPAFSRNPALGYRVMRNLAVLIAARLKRTRQLLAGQM